MLLNRYYRSNDDIDQPVWVVPLHHQDNMHGRALSKPADQYAKIKWLIFFCLFCNYDLNVFYEYVCTI